jgi:hypothetical protein
MDFQAIRQTLEALEREGVEYAVFGAAALNLHGLPRFTRDLDLFIAPDAANIERLKTALKSVFHDASIDEITANDLLGDYPAIQYVPPEGTFHLDILTRLGEAFRFDQLETARVPFEDLVVTAVTPKMLYKMKKGTVRLQDRADAELLRERFRLEAD